jgi:hypothetical protein
MLLQAFSPITAYTRFIAIIKYVGITPVAVQVQSTLCCNFVDLLSVSAVLGKLVN